MANFEQALKKTLEHEGGYVNDPDDSGGETYKGIARRFNPDWIGWAYVDKRDFKNPNLDKLVSDFYYIRFWEPLNIDGLINQEIATSIFDFAVNAGVKTSAILAQKAADVEADGEIGVNSINAINSMDAELFLSNFALAKIVRYVAICKKNPKNKKYFFGWVCRTLNQ